MNQKAIDLNLTSTHFKTPHGLDDDDHYTTAYDLAILTDYALSNNIFMKIVGTKNYNILINNISRTISNTNELLGTLEGIYGVKTGFTNGANRCLVTACNRNNLDIICVVLGCDTKNNRTKDSINLINYIYNNYVLLNIEEILINDFNTWYMLHSNSFRINKGISQFLNLTLDKSSIPYSHMAIKKSDLNNISTNISFSSYLESPIMANSLIGNMNFMINENNYFSVNIINTNEIPRKKIFYYFSYMLSNYCEFFKDSTI